MRGLSLILVAGLAVGSGLPATAQELQLSFDAGQVTLLARDVPLGAILDQWSIAGKTRFVDADGLPSQALHLQLVDVPEAEALRILLREVKGYIAAPRDDLSAGPSRFDQVILMPASAGATRAASPPTRPQQPYPSASRQPATPPRRRRSPTRTNENSGSRLSERDALSALRDLLPNALDGTSEGDPVNRTQRFPASSGSAQTAPRPGMVIEAPDDAAPVFIRPRPVRPQRDDP